MPDPNTDPMPGIAAPDIHVHLTALFYCEACDDVLLGCSTCHADQCFGVDEDEEEMLGGGDRPFTLFKIDARKVMFWLDGQGHVEKFIEVA